MDFRTHKKYLTGVFKTKSEIVNMLQQQGKTKIYYVLSFGGGTQSTHLLEEHFKGNIHYDAIIMSDTGAEPNFIHRQVDYWMNRQKEYRNTTPFIITHHNKMIGGIEEMAMRWIMTEYQRFQLPVYCSKIDEEGNVTPGGIMPRQCTVDFKIIPVKQNIRQMILRNYNLGERQRVPNEVGVIIDIGFSSDEIKRINVCQSPQFKYMYLAYPLVEANQSTENSINFLKENDMPCKRSRCYLCPFNCDMKGMDWGEIIDEEPLSFLKAVWFDSNIREVQGKGNKAMKAIPYLHFSRKPLGKVYDIQFQWLMAQYEKEFNSWLLNWQNKIEKTYLKTA